MVKDWVKIQDHILCQRKERRLGPITRPYIMSEKRTINIDEPRDLMLAKLIIEDENN